MKKLIALGAAFALVGCGEAAVEEPVGDDMAVEDMSTGPAVVDTQDVTNEAGETWTLVRYDDGTYTAGDDRTGTYYMKDDMTCYLGDAEGDEESCWAPRVTNEDGSVTSTSADGDVVTIADATM